MQHVVSLNGEELTFSLEPPPAGAPWRVRGPGGEHVVEVLSRSEQGSPALLLVDGVVFRVQPAARQPGARSASVNGRPVSVSIENELSRRARPSRLPTAASATEVRAPMPGRVVKLNVKIGQAVIRGAALLGIEAMKMENELVAPIEGTILELHIEVGATVEADQKLVVIEPG